MSPRGRNSTNWCGRAWKPIRISRKENDEARMFDELNDLYQEVILDHCKKPRNFRELSHPTCSAQGHNPLCGDQLKLFLVLEGETIKEISFVGSGCCISKASASLLTEF